ncbi:uncharacterized protein LOC107004858 isoform X2 [Solanum pennellii]|nr:uncharacterized protein LOC107004858 isoform X2 [Solanum pennellii]
MSLQSKFGENAVSMSHAATHWFLLMSVKVVDDLPSALLLLQKVQNQEGSYIDFLGIIIRLASCSLGVLCLLLANHSTTTHVSICNVMFFHLFLLNNLN